MIPMSVIDPVFAKSQLLLLLSDCYQHPNGQVAALHFDLSESYLSLVAEAVKCSSL